MDKNIIKEILIEFRGCLVKEINTFTRQGYLNEKDTAIGDGIIVHAEYHLIKSIEKVLEKKFGYKIN